MTPLRTKVIRILLVAGVLQFGYMLGDAGLTGWHIVGEQQAAGIARGHAFEYCLKRYDGTVCKNLKPAYVNNGTPGITDGPPFYGDWIARFKGRNDTTTVEIAVALNRHGQLLQMTDGELRDLW